MEREEANVDSIIAHFGDKSAEEEKRGQANAKDEPENDQQNNRHRYTAKWTM
jgi:hypothetical protein